MDYEIVVGLEVHAELITPKPRFSAAAKTAFGSEVNTNVLSGLHRYARFAAGTE